MKYRMTEHNIFQEIQEDLQRQKIEALWRRYGMWIITGAAAIVLASAGLTAWDSWRAGQNQQATAGLIHLMDTKETDDAKKMAALEAFAQKNRGVSQATFAQFQAAALAVKNGKKDEAIRVYDAIAQDTQTDTAFRQLADLVAVQVQMDSGNAAELEKRLQPLMADKSPWRYTAMEYDAHLKLRLGDMAGARTILTQLSQDASAPKTLSARATDLLNYVGP